MKNILESFLEALEVNYTKSHVQSLYNEHPHKGNMYGLKKMLDTYGIKSQGVSISTKELSALNYPCILHIRGDFAIGLDCDANTITYQLQGKNTTVPHDVFKQMWTGNALVVEETTDAFEPDYKLHQWNERVSTIKTYSVPFILMVGVGAGIASHFQDIGFLDFMRMALSVAGILVCAMLMEKQLFGESRYGDRVCSLFHHADCNSVLDGPMAKVFGISWSEVGLGYFSANVLLLSLFPASSGVVALINWVAMAYGIWSIYYQWHVAKSWCVLCIIVQLLIWLMGMTALLSHLATPLVFEPTYGLLTSIAFAVCIMSVHMFSQRYVIEKERVRAVQLYRSLKANSAVAKTLIEQGEFYETTLNDSSIIFGNPEAKMCVTILSNPHCNPCARMHNQVEKLLSMSGNDMCIQYIFSAFNKQLEDSSRYLIACYLNHPVEEALHKFAQWYTQDKFNYKRIIKQNAKQLHTEAVEVQMKKHSQWREKTSLIATPTVLVNGHKLPHEYELGDLAMMPHIDITKKNILQDINGKHAPLTAK